MLYLRGWLARRAERAIRDRLGLFRAVAVLGPRQVGKTTLVRVIAESQDSEYLDLENPHHIRRLSDPVRYPSSHAERLVVLDEVQRTPELFAAIRGVIDGGKWRGLGTGRFLLSGSASVAFLNQSSESLAGRIAYIELNPFDTLELSSSQTGRLWVRGGFPPAFCKTQTTAASSGGRR